MKTIQEMLQELSQCIVTVSGEFRFRTNWNGGRVPQPDLDTFDPNVPFCIENVGDVPVEIGLYNHHTSKAIRSNCKISYNLKTWQDYNLALTTDEKSTDIGKITLTNKGDRVYIKADKDSLENASYPYAYTQFKIFNQSKTTKIRARGNIDSLNHGTDDLYKTNYLIIDNKKDHRCYYYMFRGCTSLTQAPELPATTLADNCYSSMFEGCTSLTQAPKLPATTLTKYCYNYMFYNCKSLVQAPELPATTLADNCYSSMFEGCTSLTQAPDLPATTLAYECYGHMFHDCTSLTQAPELRATKLFTRCYQLMFYNCKSLVQAPELPATTLADNCYSSMFEGCTSLTQAPDLPAIKTADSCYVDMFNGCTSLTQAPELPATTLADYCYRRMFQDCTSLTQAPGLQATTLATGCYENMFQGCTKLNYVKCLATDTSAAGCTYNWLYNVSATGTFECDNKKYFTVDSSSGIPVGWTITEINPDVEKPDLDTFDPNVPFCIENVGDVQANIQYNTKNTNIRISKDYKTWNDYKTGDSIILDPTDRVYIKSDYVRDTSYNPRFVFNGDGARLRARGNIASLLYGTNDAYVNKYTSTEEYCYSSMFKGCTSLTQAPDLPATTLASYCYANMFYNCTSLTQPPELHATTLADCCYFLMFANCTSLAQAPELPTTTLANSCYYSMFNGCTSLTQAPELPATALSENCYNSMFKGCTSLTQAPDLPATTLANYCYHSMFNGCTSLTHAPELSATTLTNSCYYEMFNGCTSLTQAPDLPATTLADTCYRNMFSSCTSLVQAQELPATKLAKSCYNSMFKGCTSLTQAPDLPATTLANYCYSNMFSGCTSLVQAPELPATTLVESCYYSMFSGCVKINYVKCLATDTSANICTKNWLNNVSATGTFECDNKKYFTLDSPDGIPVGWTITEINPDPPTPPEPEKPDLDTFDPNVPFCIENVGDVPVEIGLSNITSNIRTDCEISYNNQDWITYTLLVDPGPPDIEKITLSNKGDRVYIKANHPGTIANPTPYTHIRVLNESTSTKIQARGNIASLNYAKDDVYKTNYYNTLPDACYVGLFMGCKSLVKAPDLPAINLSKLCYMYMFSGCTNLKYIYSAAANLASNCTLEWVKGVSSVGDFYAQSPAIVNWTTGDNGIPAGWTRHQIYSD